ncbi:hypothetical protein AAG570_008456 [Ranatra chinensis]|uniref:Uncharacterized protein n=1 Tax=Ranatra chinensis TaxID=642074 RepID=A0ABD0YR15_9HEMI
MAISRNRFGSTNSEQETAEYGGGNAPRNGMKEPELLPDSECWLPPVTNKLATLDLRIPLAVAQSYLEKKIVNLDFTSPVLNISIQVCTPQSGGFLLFKEFLQQRNKLSDLDLIGDPVGFESKTVIVPV